MFKSLEHHAVFKAASELFSAGNFTPMTVCVSGSDAWVECGIHPGWSDGTLVLSWTDKPEKHHIELALNPWEDQEAARTLAAILFAWANTNHIHNAAHVELPQTQIDREPPHDPE